MSKQHHETSDIDLDLPFDRGDSASPGKRSMTQGLSPRPIIFRVESAEAARELGVAFGPRDRNGVAAGAETAVDQAAGSSGEPLRDDLRARFESSLGSDLSAVRVHTGGASAEASAAVGAKAYTVGNDVHFGAGQYQPDDPFGMHLIAHEVAHTQQQAGGAAHRQNKLEVSTPGDSAEVEADQAADAMVAGAAVGSLSRLGVMASRTNADDISDAADSAPRYHDPTLDPMEKQAAKLSLTGEFSNASEAIRGISSETESLKIFVGNRGVEPSMIATNTKTVCELQSYVENLDIQDGAMSQFQVQYAQSGKDYDRLKNAVLAFKGKYPSLAEQKGTSDDAETEGKFELSEGSLEVKSRAKITDAQGKQLEDSHGDVTKSGKRDLAQSSIADVQTSLKKVSTAQGTLQGKQMDLQAMSAEIAAKAGRVAADSDNAAIKKVNSQIAAFKATVGQVINAVKLVITQSPAGAAKEVLEIAERPEFQSEEELEMNPALPKPSRIPGHIEDKASKVATVFKFDIVDEVAKAMFAQATATAEAIDAEDITKKEFAHEHAKLLRLKESKLGLTEAAKAYADAVKEFEQRKATMRSKIREMGKEADKRTGNTGAYEAASVLYGECSNYVAQAKLTHELGAREKARGSETKATREGITDYQMSDAEKGAGAGIANPSGIVYYSMVPDGKGSYEPKVNHVGKDKLKLNTYTQAHGFTTSHEREKAAVVEDLAAKYNNAQNYRAYLGGVLKIY